jgi:hypothetical protein
MLPEGNQIAECVYEAKKIICPLGIEVEKIMHARTIVYCPMEIMQTLRSTPSVAMISTREKKDGGDDNNADDENEPSEIRGKKKKAKRGAPVRVAWYFCIISCLRKCFTTRKGAQLLRWHDEGRKELKKDGKFRHPADVAQYGNINNHFLWFDKDIRSIWFAMSTDGVNPFGNQSSTHSTWPVVLLLYNLTPGYARNKNL